MGDRTGEGKLYETLGNAYISRGDFLKAFEYHEKRLKIAIEIGQEKEEPMEILVLRPTG